MNKNQQKDLFSRYSKRNRTDHIFNCCKKTFSPRPRDKSLCQTLPMEEYMQSPSSHIDPSIITQSTLYKAGAGAGKTTNLDSTDLQLRL